MLLIVLTKNLKFMKFLKNIKNKLNVSLSYKDILCILKTNNLKYDEKIRINSNPYSKEKQKEQLIEIKNKIQKNNINNLITIDEITVKEFENFDKGCRLKGIEPEVINKNKKINNKRYIVLMASSNKKIINYIIVEKGIKTYNFNKFILKLNKIF